MVSATWDVLWTWRAPKISWAELLPWQRVNHFPQARHLTRKDLLKKHLQRQRQLSERLAESFDIMPLTFTLPAELLAFTEAFSVAADAAKEAAAAAEAAASALQRDGADPGTSGAFARAALAAQAATNLWILKPVGLSRGRGTCSSTARWPATLGMHVLTTAPPPSPHRHLDGGRHLRRSVRRAHGHPTVRCGSTAARRVQV
jgi:hypothetical protein